MIHQSLERKCAEFAVEIASSNEDNKKTESDALVSEDSSDDNNNTASSNSLFESPTKRAKTSASSIGVLVQCGCDCKENHCLGFWCTCFRTKEFCSKKCTCRECCNNEKHKEKVMIPRAIKQEEICSSSGVQCACDCKENHCLGFWCTCFRTKEFCSKKCTCRECCNNEKHKEKVMMSRAIKQEEICSCKTGLCTTDLCYCHAVRFFFSFFSVFDWFALLFIFVKRFLLNETFFSFFGG
ncbi:PREDICTED: protein tesmin/TSO1-like CXC 2 isoform X2 [Erythranthe guttata]|uniref:protein tesmin/TSO1-like CXC 2 isoform X2 n=1 Tax=Erythranthe guttata TaxID=4155 RepID=UPI00064DBD63|nr:PREDICTED: protein tesmin/TSO1-like CXC 2 isoform X2 [Erythranthe guttata]|eukprot:XP_012855880.1 PREDICTED: protein tesmin/TSO1-like CXC 2 isoform X2 [Erythranthe guttata]